MWNFFKIVIQVGDAEPRKSAHFTGTCRKGPEKASETYRKTPQINGTGKQYSKPDVSRFFRRFPIVFCGKEREVGWKS